MHRGFALGNLLENVRLEDRGDGGITLS